MNDATENSVSLRHDLVAVLMEFHRSQQMNDVFRKDVSIADIATLGEAMAYRLGSALGGQYVPKRAARDARDAAVVKQFNGKNHAELMVKFAISRRLVYSILARKRKGF